MRVRRVVWGGVGGNRAVSVLRKVQKMTVYVHTIVRRD